MTIRRAAAAFSTAALLLLAVAGPALAETTPRYEGEDPAPPMTPLVAVLVFVGIPAAVFAVVVLLVMAPSWTRAGRYRPGMGWFAEPMWIKGPSATGGSAAAALPGRAAEVARTQTGGASARW